MTAWTAPTGVTVAVRGEATRSERLASALTKTWDLPLTTTHTEQGSVEDSSHTPAETLAAAIAAAVPHDHLLVIESTHADRWRSRYSVAEQLIDEHAGLTIALGPSSQADIVEGPIVVALDGSQRALGALPTARSFAAALNRPLLLARVVGEPDPEGHQTAALELAEVAADDDTASTTSIVVESNDPITALVAICVEHQASFIALASSGDRETTRSTMSRTTAGLIAEAPCPVLVSPAADESA